MAAFTIAKLLEGAKCYKCIPRGSQREVQIYLLYLILKKKLVPASLFSWEPESAIARWIDPAHPGPIGANTDLSGFNALADKSNVTSIEWLNGDLTSVNNVHLLPSLLSFRVNDNLGVTSISVGGATSITFFDCNSCSLSGILDITTCTSLQTFSCAFNSISGILLSGIASLNFVECQTNSMSSTSVDSVICQLDSNGAINGTLDITSNSAPGAAGLTCSANLDPGKGWTVTHD